MTLDFSRTAVIIPTRNAARHWQELSAGIRRQGIPPTQVVIIDSSSTDGTVERARADGYQIIQIDLHNFNHGGTRQVAADFSSTADVLIYLSQDAIPRGENSFRTLVDAFRDPKIGAAYGRQLPRADAGPIEAHARLYNYPATSSVRTMECRTQLGFKSIFFSNSFGAYRRSALLAIGGFKSDVPFGEDTVAVAQMLRKGWQIAYVADATVEHSHDLSLRQEFQRYVDIGTLHRREHWLVEEFGQTGKEGYKFARSEMRYLLKHAPHQIPFAALRSMEKYFGYRTGLKGADEKTTKR